MIFEIKKTIREEEEFKSKLIAYILKTSGIDIQVSNPNTKRD